MAFRFWATLLFFCLASGVVADSTTLQALRADLASGSLKPVLARQALIPIPDQQIARWVQDVNIEQFAITGFNENRARFAARVRLHFADGGIGFLRLEGEPGEDYRLTEWYDYSSGLQLSDLIAYGARFNSGQGKAFLAMLQNRPGSPELASLAAGRPVLQALWLAQCSDKPCEDQALAAQEPTNKPALWQLEKPLASDQDHYRQISKQLHDALGDDPYLWWLKGQLALLQQRCEWVQADLEQAWQRHPEHRLLADVALQCYLAVEQGGTEFLDQLSVALGADTVSAAIGNYYQQQGAPVPAIYQPWTVPGEN
ncbi:hypothetical protein [Alcanivorax jadensis]|uniref:hypothetical protein n=1 Tax=Alcanivorax jadensis TaxID=64988 RepID=UPI00356803FC